MPARKNNALILGSRGSRLALWQAEFVKQRLKEQYPDLKVEIRVIKTTGDIEKKKPLYQIGGKYLFIKEIEESLKAGKIDVGVHSMKDLPASLPEGFSIGAILKREDPRDVFVSRKYDSLLHLPKKAVVGTSSLRRQAQLKNFRPDLEVVPLRGNVETRLKKISSGKVIATILAAAGMIRLGLGAKITEYLSTTLMLPSVGQGAIGLEIRAGDAEKGRFLEFLNDMETVQCLTAERSFLKAVGGDCRSPVAAYAEVSGMNLKLTGMIATPDGRELIRDRIEGNFRESEGLGQMLAKSLFSQGAREILRTSAEYRKK